MSFSISQPSVNGYYTSAKKLCPICGKPHGCRVLDTGDVLCLRTYNDHGIPVGYRFVKQLSNGMGGLIARDTLGPAYTPRIQSAPKPERDTLPDRTLDTEFRNLYQQLSIHSRHRAKLEKRGSNGRTVQRFIDDGFRSWVPRKRVTGVDTRLPGLKPDGTLVGAGGMTIPAYTPDRKLVGFQVASDRVDEKGKYVYLWRSLEVRDNPGPLLFTAYGLPDYSTVEAVIPEATLLCASRRGPDGVIVSAVLQDTAGVILKSVTKRFRTDLPQDHADYNAILLGLQMCLAAGVTVIWGFTPNERVYLQLLGEEDVNPGLAPLHHLCSRLLSTSILHSIQHAPDQYLRPAIAALDTVEPTDDYYDTRTVWLVDGALKSWLTAERHGVTVIGCPGGLHGSNQFDLGRYLSLLQAERVIVMPDAGDVVNHHTARSNNATIKSVEDLGYPVSVGWWGQTNKPKASTDPGDIDEIPQGHPIELLTPVQFADLHPSTVADVVGKEHAPGIHRFDEPVSYPRLQRYREPVRFKRGSRLSTVLDLVKTGSKAILDGSAAGLGKSTDVSNWQPADFDAYQLLWLVDDPVTTAYPGWEQYRGRDAGRVIRPDGRVVRAQDETDLYLEANCQRSKRSDWLLTRGLVPDVATVCVGCPAFDDGSCKSKDGSYLHDRGIALGSTRVRLPAAALGAETLRASNGQLWKDAPEDSRQPGTVIVVDDVDPWVTQLSVGLTSVQTLSGQLLPVLEQHPELLKTFATLQRVLDEKQGRSWVNRSNLELLDLFPGLPALPADVLSALYGIETDLVLQENSKVSRVWLKDFIEVLQGKGGYLYTYQGRLHINRVNARFTQAITHPAVKTVVFMDATAKVEYLQNWLNVTQIPFIAEADPAETGNLRVTQVIGLGDLGYQRTKRQKTRLDRLKNALRDRHPGYAEIDIKGSLDTADLDAAVDRLRLTWLSTSRGSNAAKDRPGLLCYGTPRANLSAAIARYCLMTGQVDITPGSTLTTYPMQWGNRPGYWGRVVNEADHDGFAEFYHVTTQAEIWQGYNRLRHAIRPGETLDVIHVTEYPLSLPTTVLDAAELLDEQPVTRLTPRTIVDALATLYDAGRPVTQTETADHLGVTIQTLTHTTQRDGLAWSDLVALAITHKTAESTEKPVECPTIHSLLDQYRHPWIVPDSTGKSRVSAISPPIHPATPGSGPAAIDTQNPITPGTTPVNQGSTPAYVDKGG